MKVVVKYWKKNWGVFLHFINIPCHSRQPMPPQYNVSPSRGSGNRFPMPQQIYPQSVSHRVYTHDNDTIRHQELKRKD